MVFRVFFKIVLSSRPTGSRGFFFFTNLKSACSVQEPSSASFLVSFPTTSICFSEHRVGLLELIYSTIQTSRWITYPCTLIDGDTWLPTNLHPSCDECMNDRKENEQEHISRRLTGSMSRQVFHSQRNIHLLYFVLFGICKYL